MHCFIVFYIGYVNLIASALFGKPNFDRKKSSDHDGLKAYDILKSISL